ncbi:hypothetical protein AAT19DRAFT_12830 [Rhodotorula toruloides]|uniref:Uncharacterized protein n=1 Tax=Rhodotorula toruloides TaxID=5286 RepID=A0A2T0ACR9_RHOTO|nr:hypothetical protein AAT19DRAFT_12830 [Rhodotorula toruloides]
MLPSHALEIPAAPRTPSHAVLALPSPRLTTVFESPNIARRGAWRTRSRFRLNEPGPQLAHTAAHPTGPQPEHDLPMPPDWTSCAGEGRQRRITARQAQDSRTSRHTPSSHRCVNPRPGCSCSTPHALHFEAGWCSG